jgi:hypothetical protein
MARTDEYPVTNVKIDPRHVLGVSAGATSTEILAAFTWLTSREIPTRGGYEQRIARLTAARDALLEDDGL